ncbi:hypothetical protein M085_5064 [Bacteroides fragilis str. 3986 N(B)19]|nr:hypothetical protein M085_5064 [Bacteroides fragilis str. 3986 N(B)19]
MKSFCLKKLLKEKMFPLFHMVLDAIFTGCHCLTKLKKMDLY